MPNTSTITLGVLTVCLLTLCPPLSAQTVHWQGDLAVISWTEPLSDPTAPAGTVPFRVVTGPYIGWLAESSATIGWEVVASVHGTAVPPITFNPVVPLTAFAFRSASLTGLVPGQTFQYQLVCSTATWVYRSAIYSFKTLSKSAPAVRFALFGDTQYGDGYSALGGRMVRRFSDHVRGWNPDLVLQIGDLVYGGQGYTLTRKSDWYDLFGRMHPLRAGYFLAAVPGNHDIRNYTVSDGTLQDAEHAWVLEYLKDYPVQPANAGGRAWPPFYYSFDVGPVHFVALMSEINTSDTATKLYQRFTLNEQAAWLEEDLKASIKPWKIAFFHHPNFIGQQTSRGTIGSILTKYKIQMALGGHEHFYAANYRLPYPGITTFSDSGTMMITASTSSDGGLGCAYPLKTRNLFCLENISYMQFEIAGDTANFRAVDSTGTAVDGWKVPLVGQPVQISTLVENTGTRRPTEALLFSPVPAIPGVRIRYAGEFGDAANSQMEIFDAVGRRLFKTTVSSGNLKSGVIWNAVNASSGIHFVRLTLSHRTVTGRMALIR